MMLENFLGNYAKILNKLCGNLKQQIIVVFNTQKRKGENVYEIGKCR